jgi:putative transcriptional regulator
MKNKIRIYRAIKSINQEVLAQAINVSRQTISAIEKNKFSPSLPLAFKIAYYFNVKIEDIFIFDEESNESSK